MVSINNSKCILVTGATSGIGRALALAISELPSKPTVIAAGRRQERLDELAAKGLKTIKMDVGANKDILKGYVSELISKYPDLDGAILCAGIQNEMNFSKIETVDIDYIEKEMYVNYTSVVTTIAALLPHFRKLGSQDHQCFISPVTSGLAILPAPWVPNYSATKAALHSLSLSLSLQLKGTGVHVMEIIPPLVESELHDTAGTTDRLSKFWMPLDEYTKSVMEGLQRGDTHIAVGASLDGMKKFEAGKRELSEKMMKQFSVDEM